MRMSPRSFSIVALSVALGACAASETPRPATGAAGTSGAAGNPGSAGTMGTAGVAGGAGASGAAGSGPAGTSGGAGMAAAGTNGGAGMGAAGMGAAGTGTSDGGAGISGGAGATGAAGGAASSAGCAGKNYQLCIDFESGIDTAVWSGGTATAVDATHAAHGKNSYHLYNATSKLMAGRLLSKTVGTIKDQVYARFYIHFSPGAPGGHGNIVAAYDKSGSWYEMGYQFDGMMGVWHGGGGEHPRRSKPYIVDQWYCIEAFFDGKSAAMPKWWIDGADAIIYDPVWANGNTTKEGGPTPTVSTQFTRMEAGFTPYAGLALKQPDTVGDQTDTRVLQDLWIDDIAFDTQRIGCIQ